MINTSELQSNRWRAAKKEICNRRQTVRHKRRSYMHIDHALTDRYFLNRCKITDIERVSKFYQYVSENTENMARFGK